MDLALLVVLTSALFVSLLLLGRRQLAKGANVSVANGGVLLVLSTLVGLLALATVLSLDVW